MSIITIHSAIMIHHAMTDRPLFSGDFADIKACAEAAAAQGIDLSGADLRHANLANADLDGVVMKGARLDHANLAGANLSEAMLEGGIFANAALQNTCLCFARLDHCDFSGASFGATDIAGASLNRARFSTLSAFTLNFRDTEGMDQCVWINENGMACPFSRPPVAIGGMIQPIVLLDRHAQVGPVTLRLEDWNAHDGGLALHPFISAVRKPLNDLMRCRFLPAHSDGNH